MQRGEKVCNNGAITEGRRRNKREVEGHGDAKGPKARSRREKREIEALPLTSASASMFI